MLAEPEAKLASAALASGRDTAAIRTLERELDLRPDDPAVLINLGIAYAHRGDDQKARALFKAAMASDDKADLETADGSTTDSRKLARKALSMLDRGAFRPISVPKETLTLRD
ncbi:tetratricopeptide repeat protein [Erythrobacter sp. THAF29]|uniref:tetratricopeptide repeat protein n=1 Tax=Erythrobacter sp. THAF29 TaxID=2587851 RepID=UPI0015621696|nr:tetratricopeptide repeat protein [Erythrobacter sp. THAF29]